MARKRRWISGPSGDVVGWRRDMLIQEHLEWMQNGGAEAVEKDFTDAPIAQWLSAHKKDLASRRPPGVRRYKNTKSRKPGR